MGIDSGPGLRTGRWTAVRTRLVQVAFLALGTVLAPAGAAAAVRLSVPCGGAHGGVPGLVAAIQRANSQGGGDVTLGRRCTYTLLKGRFSDGRGPAGLPPISARITITGRSSSIVRRKGSPQFRLLEVANRSSASLTVTSLTLTGGNVTNVGGGGAILLGTRGALVVRGSTLASDSALNGGAIDAGGAAVKIVNSRLRDNQAVVVDGVGGAVVNVGGPLTIESSVVADNRSSGGGGGVSGQSLGGHSRVLKIIDSTISDNRTFENGGGGIFAFGPERLVISGSTIAGNRFAGVGVAGAGGGIFNGGRLTMTDSTVSGNVAGGSTLPDARAGGIFDAAGATGTITASTIAANSTLGPGAAGGGIVNGSALMLTATIVSGNRAGNCLGHVGDGGFDLEAGNSCGFARHAVNANPLLASLADNGGPTMTMALTRRSPAINRVPANRAPCRGTADQRGVQRPQGPRCDIGAFEVVATKTSLSVAALGQHGGRVRLTATVKPRVAIPGPPHGMVVFRDAHKVLGERRLDGRKLDTASLRLRLSGTKHRLTATYQGSALFLSSIGGAARSR